MTAAEELQAVISREKWRNFEAAQAATAGASLEKQVADVVAAFKRKHPHAASLVANPTTVGPQEAQARQLCAAIAVAKAKMKAGDFVEASAGSGRAVHKLPTYVVGGRG
jgi:hypothetical protein